MAETEYDQAMQRLGSAREERDRYMDDWRNSSDFVLGIRPDFLTERDQRNKRDRNPNLLNEIALESNQVLASGMMAGITSPARPWFKLTLNNPDMAEFRTIKDWLGQVELILQTIFNRSNFYRSMNDLYFDLGAYGITAMGAYKHFENVLRTENYSAGSYMVSKNGEREIDSLYREFSLTVGEIVAKFGYQTVSKTVQSLFDNNSLNTSVPLIHMIEPNYLQRKFRSPLSRDMNYTSTYWEKESDQGSARKPLSQLGFMEKPFMAPRWSVNGDETYSSMYPAFNTMGTNKALQAEELDLATAIEKMHNPPTIADASLENNGVDLVAGGVTYSPNMNMTGKPSVQSVYDIRFDINGLMVAIDKKEDRIRRQFFSDLFLMLSNMDRANITATEIIERKEEKLLMLGPVLERLNNELLDPIIDRTFEIASRAGILPPPPPELPAGMQIKVEYVSVLAQAQRAIATGSVEATAAFTLNLAEANPSVLDKLNFDEMVDEYALAKGASPKIIRTDREVAAIRADRQEKQQAALQQQVSAQAADTAKTLSETETEEGNALDGVTGAIQGG